MNTRTTIFYSITCYSHSHSPNNGVNWSKFCYGKIIQKPIYIYYCSLKVIGFLIIPQIITSSHNMYWPADRHRTLWLTPRPSVKYTPSVTLSGTARKIEGGIILSLNYFPCRLLVVFLRSELNFSAID